MGPIFCSGSISMEVIPSKETCFNSQATAVSNKMYLPVRLFYTLDSTKLGVASNEVNSAYHDFYSLPQDPRVIFLYPFLITESCDKSTR